MKIRNAIIAAAQESRDRIRQYGIDESARDEVLADALLGKIAELAAIDDVEKVLIEHARYKRALEYISQAPVSTETEIVLQGRAIIGLLDKEASLEHDD